ncbi:beta strand repeat-containing protein [Actinoplanes philippinensis]|uniref:beta strand repeat-containing protein n=1 Tax=Actinoplanes philippinensis TaxID=35752 RepID=UPI0034017DCD
MILALTLALPFREAPAVAAQSVCPTAVSLTNGDFEEPVIAAGQVSITLQTLVPGWLTTASDKMIELWRGYGGVTSSSGSQHAELNANMVSTLYQDLTTIPGQILRWQLNHRGRTGTDTMAVIIGAPTGTLVQQGANISDSKTSWGSYTGTYTVPAGQTKTRFAFKSVSSASADPSIGNFLDAVSFGSAACLTTNTSVVNTSGATTANVGDTLTYTVTTRNDGGTPANLAAITDTLPAGTTYVPGSLRSVTGATTIKPTDAAGDDTGEYVSGTRTVKLRVGSGATGSAGGTLAPGESQTLTYQVLVGSSIANTTLDNDATATYTEVVTNTSPTSTSNTAAMTVNPAADLSVTAALAGTAVVAGQSASYTLTAANAGPNTAATVVLTGTVPSGLTGVTATSAGGTCSVSATKATCAYASIAAGDNRVMTVTGNVPSGETPGTAYTLGAAITSATYETNQSDNSASVSNSATASADLAVTMTYSPSAPAGGDTITYTVTVTNRGPSTARTIVLSDPIPVGSTGAQATVPGGACATTATGTIECSLASLASGATVTATITMTLSVSNPVVNNAVSLKAATPDPDVNNNIVTVTGAGALVADVGITLTLGTYTAYAGETTTYTLAVKNNGPSMADNVSFIPVLPPGVSIVRPTTGPLAAYCTPTACTIPHLPPGATIPLSGTVVLGPDAQAGPGTATVTVVTTTTDPNAANDKQTANFTVLLKGDLSVTQTMVNSDRGGNTLVPGERIRSVVTVGNAGPTRAEGVLVQRPVPAGQTVPAAATSAGACSFQGTVDLNGITPNGGVFICSRALMDAATTWAITFDTLLKPGYSGTTFARTVTVSATSPDPNAGNDSVTTTATVQHISDLDLTQSTGTPQVVATDPVQFTVTARNAGPSDVSNVVIQVSPQTGLLISAGSGAGGYDASTGRWSIPSLAAGGTATLTLSGTALSAGTPSNVVRVVSSDSTDPASGNDTAQTAVTITPSTASLKITGAATVTPSSRQNAALTGDPVTYRFTVANDGNVTMSQIVVRDALTGAADCPGTTLAAGAQMVCTSPAPYTITQSDFDAQQPVYNNATVTARPPGGVAAVSFGPAPVTVQLAGGTASLRATVSAAVSPAGHTGAAQTGDAITYSYVVTNDGNAALNQVTVTDTKGGPVTCPGTTLAVGASMTCTSSSPYVVTQSDVDDGGPIRDSATLGGRLVGSATTRTFGPFSTGVPVTPAAPSLTAVVTATVTPPARQSAAAPGDTITYAYAVTNNGNVTMSSIAVTDTRVGTASCPSATLAVNATMTCTGSASYRVTQSDVDAGATITDSATVTGRAPGASAGSYGPFTAGVPVAVAAPALAVTVVPAVTPIARQNAVRAGDTIAYTYTVTNNGNVTMSAIAVTDTRLGAATCPATALAAGATATCTAAGAYTVTQSDVDAATGVAATASVSGRPPGAGSSTLYGSHTVTVPVAGAAPSLSVTPVATVSPAAHQSAVRVGDTITYTYTVVNDGNVSMSGISLTGGLGGTVSCPFTSLAVGASMTCASASPYTVTQARIDAGQPITASIAVAATTPAGVTPPLGPFSVTVGVAPAVPALNMLVTAFVTPSSRQSQALAGDTIAYTYDVSNTGNVTMSSIAVADPSAGDGVCPFTALAVGASMTCHSASPRAVTPAEFTAGTPITDAAVLTARAPGAGSSGTYATGADTVALAVATASLTVTVTPAVNPAANRYAVAAGNSVTHSIVVTNNGNEPMDLISLTDPLTGTAVCPGASLAAGDSMTCAGGHAYSVTQSDVDSGLPVTSTFAVAAKSLSDVAAVGYGTFAASVPVAPANPLLQLTPTAVPSGASVGSTVAFTFTVRNIGNVTMDTLAVDGTTSGAATCVLTTLAPGGTTTCAGGTAATITQSDIDTGLAISDTSQAVARRTGTTVDLTFGPQTASAPVAPAAPSLTITSVATVSDPMRPAPAAGDTITYAYTITNNGNVTMDGFSVTDSLIGAVTCPSMAVAPAGTLVCTGGPPYTVTQSDVDAGRTVVSDAYVISRQAGQPDPHSYGPATVATVVAAGLPSLTATVDAVITPAGHQAAAEAGDTVKYRTVLTNNGNQTITGITVADPRAGTAGCPGTSLAPGASMACTSASSYPVTTADIDANVPVATTVTVAGRRPGDTAAGTLLTPPASFPVIAAAPQLSLTAESTVTPGGHRDQLVRGDLVDYRFTVRNTGNVTMTGIVVTGARTGAAICLAGTLAPGATTTCSAGTPYRVIQPDVEAGQPIVESVSATARPPGAGSDLTFGPATDSEQMAVAADSLDLSVTAVVTPASRQLAAQTDDTVRFRYTVTNDGDVEVTGIAVDDALVGAAQCPGDTLTVGASMICSSGTAYTVTQADIDADRAIREPSTVTGHRPGVLADTTYDTDAATVRLVVGHGSLAIGIEATIEERGVRPADIASTNGRPAVGDGIRYHYQVLNNGNVTMSSVTVADVRMGILPCPRTTLLVGEMMTCVAPDLYIVTQADIDANLPITTHASAAGLEPGATTPTGSGPAAADTPVEPPAPAVGAEQTVGWTDTDGDGILGTADNVTSTIVVTNNGNVTLQDVALTGLPVGVTCPKTTLEPGESMVCVSDTYHLTADDIAAGHGSFLVRATATPPGNVPPVLADAPASIDPSAPAAPATPSPPTSPAPSPSATPSRTPSPSPSRSATPSRTPSRTAPASRTPSRSPTAVSPSPGGGGHPGENPITGGDHLPLLAGGMVLLGAGGVLLMLANRRNRRFQLPEPPAPEYCPGLHRQGVISHRAWRR